jgi:hypothetical protein
MKLKVLKMLIILPSIILIAWGCSSRAEETGEGRLRG